MAHFLKLNQNLVASGQKQLTALQAKLHYLNIISQLPSYGAKCFNTSIGVRASNKKDTNKDNNDEGTNGGLKILV